MSTTHTPSLQSVLVGGDSLLIECGELLLRGNHTIAAVAASSPRVAEWANSHGLAVIDATRPAAQWAQELADVDHDWLFAITYLGILPERILEMPRLGAINFHDGPLPAYRGLNAPVWALLNAEERYGISWHLITAGVDQGDIVASRDFDIAPGETALSLNTRNFEAAIEAFDELIGRLASGLVDARPQDATAPSTTYLRADRPPGSQVLDWRRPAEALERLVRALTFGPYPNPMGFAKLWTDSGTVLVASAARTEDEGASGRVLDLDSSRIVVGCADGAIAITEVMTLDGQAMTIDEVVTSLHLALDDQLPALDDSTVDRLSATDRRMARAEQHHLSQLESLEPVELPWARTATPDTEARFASVPLETADRDAGPVVAAFATVLARLAGKKRFHLAVVSTPSDVDLPAGFGDLISPSTPFEVNVSPDGPLVDLVHDVVASFDDARARPPWARELVARYPQLARSSELVAGRSLPVSIRLDHAGDPLPGVVAELTHGSGAWTVTFDETRLDRGDAELLVSCITAVLANIDDASARVGDIDLLDSRLRTRVLEDWNDTVVELTGPGCLHRLVEEQVDRAPEVTAVVFEEQSITYRELDERANRLAHHLISLGTGPDVLVGIHIDRSIDLVVSVLAVHKAGGAYVPLDPAYPSDRLAHMISDSGCPVILTHSAISDSLPTGREETVVIELDAQWSVIDENSSARPAVSVDAHHLAYCIYTSGSTGLPKGVLVEHRNAANFFVGMDERVPHELPATWLAVTSLSFDISVLELVYTLTRGFTVVVYLDHDREGETAAAQPALAHGDVPIDFSLFYFSGDEAESSGSGKYRLLLDGARFADDNGFCAVWTPERHFHAFGGLYPQPAVTGAAVAAITKRVGIRAGSVVMPLTDPIRVAEAWSIVDNLSDGRVGVSMASGWQPNDFVLKPENYANAKQAMFDGIDAVTRLWRGEEVSFDGPLGQVAVRTLPRPVQPELPVWVTTAGNPDTYIQAGRIGANVLTHLLGQSVEQLAPKIQAYRDARAEAGFDPDAGVVTLMLHTYVGDDDDHVRELVREPLKQYLGTSFSLLREYAWSFPAFQRPAGSEPDASLGDDDFKNLSDEDLDAVLEFAFARYYETSGLFGSPERCLAMVDRLKGIGVGEIACLIDFGVDTERVLASLPALNAVREMCQPPEEESRETTSPADQSFAAQVRRNSVTHLQCTPSMARMLTMHDESRAALSEIGNVFIGGEAFPVALANDLRSNAPDTRITNMYGPTETTIWSTTWPLDGDLTSIPIGTPIANTRIYILDPTLQPLPPGVPGELWIGGDGVVRGYHERPELTAERFVPDPFRTGEHRMYRTGDLARWSSANDGAAVIEFLGRTDHQVKIRGYRIELGEIEAQLGRLAGVRECVAVVREDTPGDQQLVAYVSHRSGETLDPASIKASLRSRLPEVMVPAHVAILDDLPHTPNGKIDRNALPTLAEVAGRRVASGPPASAENDVERQVLAVWQDTLGIPDIGVEDNFFDIGGHSLLIVRMHRRLKEDLDRDIALTDLYRYPTVRGFAESLGKDLSAEVVQTGVDRAARRRENLQRRRTRS
ncbi:MAG: MupA/Atu3671 family FMN-dependent luciferase-like monooxygenase [Acidimicrobiales bacterium]